jgi:hypothetical protein
MDLDGFVVEIAGRLIPLTAFAAVGREFDDVAVGAAKRLVFDQYGLREVIALRNFGEAPDWITEARAVESGESAGAQVVDVQSERKLSLDTFVLLKSRFFRRVGGKE